MNAMDDVKKILKEGEFIEAIVFGDWGWGGHDEPEPYPVPKEKKGVILSEANATPMMDGWSFNGGFGAATCYATYIWTNQRTLWVTNYDGATYLSSAPRNPISTMPEMSGGG